MASAADLRRPLGLSYFRRGGADQIHAMDSDDDDDIASFHRHLGDIFLHLSTNSAGLLSIDWLRKLLDTFLLCQEEFRIILHNHGAVLTPDFLDRSIKALDLLNAVRDGIDQLRQWRNHLDIVLTSLNRSPFSQGQLRRAHKALLAHLDTSNNDTTAAAAAAAAVLPRRNRSFGRPPNKNARHHFRSLSWSVSRSWSAARQLQALATNLAAPRAQDVAASRGLANLFYAMSSVVLFVSFALVAAIPCQDRGLHVHFSVPRCFPWGAPMVSMHERIVEESKKRERNQASGLLSEVIMIEKCAGRLMELIDKSQVRLSEEGEVEVKREVEELAAVCRVLKEGLDPLEHQVREVFHRIVRFRTKGLDSSSSQTLIEA